jgi:hypothetical protein
MAYFVLKIMTAQHTASPPQPQLLFKNVTDKK